MCQIFVIATVEYCLSFIFIFHPLECIFSIVFTGTKYCKLYIHTHDFTDTVCDHVNTFLVCQTGYKTDQRLVRAYFKAKFLLQSFLVLCLSFLPVIDIIVGNQSLICLRIPFNSIDTVNDTPQISLTITQNLIHSFTIGCCQNFVCICWRYCCDLIRIDKTCLHEGDTCIETDGTIIEVDVWQTKTAWQHINTEVTLECKVMNCVNMLDHLITVVACITCMAH